MRRGHDRFGALYGVFAARAGGGNVAGVVLDADGLSDAQMQAAARDLAAPTTGFVATAPSGPGLRIRFFTPRQEITACGYVTIAAATALRDAGRWTSPGSGTLVAAGGSYDLTLGADGVRLDVPVPHSQPLDDEPPSVGERAGGRPSRRGAAMRDRHDRPTATDRPGRRCRVALAADPVTRSGRSARGAR
jgi:predicted PhzF superfamily epimerase YddE/YHI9